MIERRDTSSSFFAVSLETLRDDTSIPFHVFLKHTSSSQCVLYRHKHNQFNESARNNLIENGVSTVYIPRSEVSEYFEYISHGFRFLIEDEAVPVETKTRILYETTTSIMEDLFTDPRSSLRIQQAKGSIHAMVDFMLRDDDAARNLIFLTSHDYYTYTHSVNVTIYSMAMLRRIYESEYATDELHQISEGFLFHDIGKSRIPLSIINFPGKLNNAQWDLMRKHPELGVSIISKANHNNTVIETIILQHHERMDGKGYPYGISKGKIHPFGRICQIADVFDAITTVRSYREPLSTFEALRVMRDDMGDHFDWFFFDEFVKLFKADGESQTLPV